MLRQTVRGQCLKSNIFWLNTLVLSILLLFCSTGAFADDWREVAPGIEYRDLGERLLNPWAHIHVFRIDPKQNELDLVLASELSFQHASVDEFSEYSHALITLNGGFFDRKFHPLGLRVSGHGQQNPLKRISWWGIFYIKDGKPYIATHRQFPPIKTVDFALQSGPRLIIDGKIPSLKPGVAERSALGITADDKVIVLVTDNTPMSTTTLAQVMKSDPLNCVNALNLDGGSSSQLKANIDSFAVDVHGFSRVSDAIVIKPRFKSNVSN
ncbi:phosphodiester glycosidase family protein [Legionella yabuuchiae]|uniref:phosphodiester glycosidase family protein n=1 Tax=Legionella yabuuchiae TaxID=376727 RepID=UPI001054676F|nr:phosphodiester glycosidase family protein [Legionella yabuuchiae]